MDYASIHGPGISNFSPSSPHRLPTVSVAAALQDLKCSPTRYVSTGLRDLDAVLQNRDPTTIQEGEVFHGGVSKGKVTEIYGPPGVGKTALGMQLAASALHAGGSVIWVDASHPIPGPRFSQILQYFQPLTQPLTSKGSDQQQVQNVLDLVENLVQFSVPTLAHLVALLCNQTPNHPDSKASLIIVDSFSTLIGNAFPRTSDSTSTPKKPGAPNPSSRKFPLLQFLINSLQKLAATRHIAIVIFSQCVTKMRPGLGAVLVPSINTAAWEQGLGYRVALFRDWGWDDEDGNLVSDVRLVEVVKSEGVAVTNGRGRIVALSICETGLQQINLPFARLALISPHSALVQQLQNTTNSPILPPSTKRKLSTTDFEIPDSDAEDDEDYGWAEEDEEDVPAMPPQWQGSEDILVPPPGELEADEEGGDGDLGGEAGEDGLDVNVEMEDEGAAHVARREEVEDSEDELAF